MFQDDYNLQKIKKIKLAGFSMYVTPRYINHYVKNQYEPFSSEIIKNYLKDNSTFLDIGAHYGYYSLLAYHSQKNVQVISVEPVKENFEILKKNLKLNNVKSEIYNYAASDKKEIKEFNLTEASDSAGFYKHPLAKIKRKIKIKSLPLDEMLKNKKIDFIKIDVEGHEIAVLDGLKKTLTKNKNVIMLAEFNPSLQKNAGFQPNDLLKKLEALNFELFLLDELNRKYYRLTDNKYPWQEFINESSYANILCIPKQKSLFVTYFTHLSGLGGAERSLLELLNQINKFGSLSHIILPSQGPFVEKIKEKAASFDIIPYDWWVSTTKSVDGEKYSKSLLSIFRYLPELERINPHLIYTNTLVIPWGAISAYLMGKSHVWHIHEFGQKDHGFSFDVTFRESAEFINLLSEKVIYNSKAVQQEFEKYIDHNKGETVYCNVEIPGELLKKKIEKVYESKNSLKLIIVGFIARSKGQDQAIRATIRLLEAGYNVELLVLGLFDDNDPYFLSLKNLIQKKRIKKIYFKNNVSNPYPYIKQSDLLLVCSRSEAFGRVSIEAMILKKPVICADRGANVELIKNGTNGLLYKYGDVEDLKDKIEYFIKNKNKIRQFGENGSTFVKENFNEEKYAKTIRNLLFKLKDKKIKGLTNTRHFLSKSLGFLSAQVFNIERLNRETEDLKKDLLISQKTLEEIYASKTWKALRTYQDFTKKIKTHTSLIYLEQQASKLFKKIVPLWLQKKANSFYLKTLKLHLSASFTLDQFNFVYDKKNRSRPGFTIFNFSIISWDHKFQRPQQLACQFANNEYTVFYIEEKFIKATSADLDQGKIKDLVQIKKVAENIFAVKLVTYKDYFIYKDTIEDETSFKYLTWSIEALIHSAQNKNIIFKVEMPFWHFLTQQFKYPLIYDCMDEHSGFWTHTNKVLEQEEKLAKKANLIFATSDVLYKKMKKLNKNTVMVKNACDFDYFNKKTKIIPGDIAGLRKPIIGYFGAISSWLDSKLVYYLARSRPKWSFILIGNIDSRAEIAKLKKLNNVHILGEKKYNTLSSYLYNFDVCFIPFKKIPLIEATNPIKMYEIFATGKPSVWTEVPEVKKMGDLVYLAKNKKEFLQKIEKALREKNQNLAKAREDFAKRNTWSDRYQLIEESIHKHIFPKVSIIILTFNNLNYIRRCLESIHQYSNWPNLEVILIDNASRDGTSFFLNKIKDYYPGLNVIRNEENLGFAAGNNLGLKQATGEYIILLNNDTIVTDSWIGKLINHLSDSNIGLVGPVTNWIGNEAAIDTNYKNINQMHRFAKEYTSDHSGQKFEIENLAFFCVAGRKNIFSKIGNLDERFKIGSFEDDDYCLRLRQAGYKLYCCEDVFIHHFGKGTTGKIQGYEKILQKNKKQFEKKWKIRWVPHRYRENLKNFPISQ